MTASLVPLMLRVLPLALGAALSPIILALQMLTLTSGTRRQLRAWLVALGAAVACGGWVVVGLLVVNRMPHPAHGPDPTSGAARIALALLLVSLGAKALYHRNPDAPPAQAVDASEDGSAHLLRAVLLGFAAMLSNVSSLVLFLPALHEITHARTDDMAKSIVLGVLILITLLPALVPPLAAAIGGVDARRALDRLSAVIAAHHTTINATICFVFATYLVATGVTRL